MTSSSPVIQTLWLRFAEHDRGVYAIAANSPRATSPQITKDLEIRRRWNHDAKLRQAGLLTGLQSYLNNGAGDEARTRNFQLGIFVSAPLFTMLTKSLRKNVRACAA